MSLRTLRVRGEAMSESEIFRFEANERASDSLVLRRADDSAKVVCKRIAGLVVWLPVLREVAKSR